MWRLSGLSPDASSRGRRGQRLRVDPLPQQSHNSAGKVPGIRPSATARRAGHFHGEKRDSALRTRPLAIVALCLTAGVVATLGDASAQWWPWGKDQDPPVPREPMRQPPSGHSRRRTSRRRSSRRPASCRRCYPASRRPGASRRRQINSRGCRHPTRRAPPRRARAVPTASACSSSSGWSTETHGTGQGRELLPKIEADMREVERTHRTASIRLDRADAGTSSSSSSPCGGPATASGSTTRSRARASGWPISSASASRSWAPATARCRTRSSASWRATAAAGSTSRKPASATRRAIRSPCCSAAARTPTARAGEPVRQPGFRHLPHLVRAPVRRLLLPGQLLDAAQSLRARRPGVPVAMRGAGRALLPSEPRRGGRADGVVRQPAALHVAQDGVPLPQGVRERLLVQAGGVQSGRWQKEKKAEVPAPKEPPPAGVRVGAKK